MTSMLNSQASVLGDSDGQIDSIESIPVVDVADNAPRRRKGNPTDRGDCDLKNGENNDNKDSAVACTCKGAVQAAFLITCASIIELVGNMLALIYGISYIQGACNFYDLDSDPEKKAQEYDEKLDRVLFLEKNRVGFVGILATSMVGLIVAFLLPIGTIYRSWKSLRAAMSLLFAMCLAHVVLAAIYLTDNELLATLAVVPFRMYEIFLIYNHINYYKKKKRADALNRARAALDSGKSGEDTGTASQRNLLQSRLNISASAARVAQNDKPGQLGSELNLKDDKVSTAPEDKQNKVDTNADGEGDADTECDPDAECDGGNDDDKKPKVKGKKRNKAPLQMGAQQGEWNQPNFLSSNFFQEAEPPEYK